MSQTIKLSISGRVQGVYFRKFTKQKADELGIKGVVRNCDDGRVELIAQGNALSLELFTQKCRKGPIMARVDNIEKTELKSDVKFIDFNII